MLGQRLVGELRENILTTCKGVLPKLLGLDFLPSTAQVVNGDGCDALEIVDEYAL